MSGALLKPECSGADDLRQGVKEWVAAPGPESKGFPVLLCRGEAAKETKKEQETEQARSSGAPGEGKLTGQL